MNNQSIRRLVTVLFALTLSSIMFGQSDQSIVAKVPFAFSVQQHRFGAGSYVIETLQPGIVRVRDAANNSLILHVKPNYSRSNRTPKGKLIFLRYGSEYFLREVWIPSTDFGMSLPSAPQEIAFAKTKREQPIEVAVQGH